MVDLIVPVVNMNGNTREQLVEELQNAFDKVRDAQYAVLACDWSHGRNFQTLPDGNALAIVAREQKADIVRTLDDMHRQLLRLAFEISEQGGK
jgi:hypothetical protein